MTEQDRNRLVALKKPSSERDFAKNIDLTLNPLRKIRHQNRTFLRCADRGQIVLFVSVRCDAGYRAI
jgi:hypothetical protein